jgi:hypothetical protein
MQNISVKLISLVERGCRLNKADGEEERLEIV